MKTINPAATVIVSALGLLLAACGGGGDNNPGGGGQMEQMEQMPGDGSQQMPGGGSMNEQEPDETIQPPGQGGGAPAGSGGPGSGPASSTKRPGLSAGGVTVGISHKDGLATFSVNKGGTPWTDDGFKHFRGGAGSGDWTGTATKLNANAATATERFRVITDIDIVEPKDEDYIAYGYWSRNPSTSYDSSGDSFTNMDLDNGFEPFYYGSMPYAGDVKSLVGEAIYTGDAMGAYQISDLTTTHGFFEAQISLTATFGPDGRVEGRMTGMNDTERLFLEGENPLSILSDPLSFSADYDSSGRSFANRDCGIASCDWGGYFLGPTGQAPTGAAGWFRNLTIDKIIGSGITASRITTRLDGSFGAQRP